MDIEKKYDLTDLTVLIPVRIDSIIRMENLYAVVNYLHRYFDTHIMVLEAAIYNNGITETMIGTRVEYIFIEDEDPIFYRTHYLNLMAQKVQTRFLAVWDADVVIPAEQVAASIERLRAEDCDVAFPYNGTFLDTTPIIRSIYLRTNSMHFLEKNIRKMTLPYGKDMRGGAFLVDRKKYMAANMENTRFYGWGPEDWERVERWHNLGYRFHVNSGVLFHLSHPRDMNGTHNSDRQHRNVYFELNTIRNCSAEEIISRFQR